MSMYKSKILTLTFLTLISSAVAASQAFATELRLSDCDGTLRASTELTDGDTRTVKLLLASGSSAADAMVKAKLLGDAGKQRTDHVRQYNAHEQALVFNNVVSGEWKVCKDDGSALEFASVEFVQDDVSSLRVASLVAGSAAVVSGVAIAAGGSSDENSEINSIVEPNQPDRAVTVNQPTSELVQGSTTRPVNEVVVQTKCNKNAAQKKPGTLAATNDDCREDEKADVLSPYL